MADELGIMVTELPEATNIGDDDLFYLVQESYSKKTKATSLRNSILSNVLGTASGNPAAFPDGSDNPLEACNVDINPVQDLHGYSKPWAGGAGKNKCPNPTDGNYNGVDVSTANGVVTFDGTATQNTSIDYFRNASGFPNGISIGNQYVLSIDTNNVVNVQIIISTDNSTFSEVLVSVGKGYSSNIATFTLPNNTTGILIRSFIAQNNSLDGTAEVMIRQATEPSGYEPYSNICPISPRTAVNITVSATQGGAGEDTQISLGRNVYGGTLNVKTGELTVDRRIISENDFTLMGGGTSGGGLNYFQLPTTDAQATSANAISNMLEQNQSGWSSTTPCFSTNTGASPNIYPVRVYAKSTSLANFKSEYSGLQIVYQLQTPQTYTLTPAEVRSILGQNYIEADSGDIAVAYVRDLNSCISNIISRIEALEQVNANRSLGLNRSLSKGVEEPQEEVKEEPQEEVNER